jgi:hypothetical protein
MSYYENVTNDRMLKAKIKANQEKMKHRWTPLPPGWISPKPRQKPTKKMIDKMKAHREMKALRMQT